MHVEIPTSTRVHYYSFIIVEIAYTTLKLTSPSLIWQL